MSENGTRRLAYWYAVIDLETRKCLRVETSTQLITQEEAPDYIRIAGYIPEYENKYYINGAWYEDAAGTIPWTPPE